MVEANPRITARRFAAALPRLLGVPLHLETELVAIHGSPRVEGVTLRRADGSTLEIEADGVVVTGAFIPEATLARLGHLALDAGSGGPAVDQHGRCSDGDFFAAGNILRAVETAGWSWQEGVAAGDALAESLAGRLAPAGRLMRVAADHPAIKLALPQRLALPAGPGGAKHLHLRLARAVRGRLTASDAGGVVWEKPVDSLPERRLLVPLEGFIDRLCGDTLTLSIDEQA
jgi:hypothetical protein